MLPAQHARRRRSLGTSLRRALQGRGWQACLGLTLLLLANEWKASRERSAHRQAQVVWEAGLAAFEQVAGEQGRLLHELAQGVEAVENATSVEAAACRLLPPVQEQAQLLQRHRHKLAVIVPHRGREEMLAAFLPAITSFLKAQGRDFGVFVVEQTARLRFNRGLLLNAGVLLLAGSGYDYYVLHDVDTTPTETGAVPYDYPAGDAPLHLTPPGIHPQVRYEEFFGGVTAFTPAQLRRVNGFGNSFWGWGREDDNMRSRLQRVGMWPPQRPTLPRRSPRFYFRHSPHPKAPEVRVRNSTLGREFFEVDPDQPYGSDLIISSQPGLLDDMESGLSSARFWVHDIVPLQGLAVRFLLELHCDRAATPWCEP